MVKEIGHDRSFIELVELYPCTTKEELRARDGHFIRERGTLNTKVAGRTRKEWEQ